MRCSKCQAENADGAQYCERCGASLEETVVPSTDSETVAATEPAEGRVQEVSRDDGNGKVNFFATIKRVFVKPATMLNEDLPKYSNAKNAGIMALIALALSVVIGIITTLMNLVFDFSCSKSRGCKFEFDTDMLEYVKFGDLLFNGIASTVVTMLMVASVFFGVAQIFKYKKINFWKMLTIVSVVMFPMIAMSFVAAIVGIFSAGWAVIVSMIGALYAAVVFYEGVTKETQAEGDKKIYYVFLATVAIIVVMLIVAWLIGEKIGMADLSALFEL